METPSCKFTCSGGSPSEGQSPPRGSPRKVAFQRVLKSLCGALFEGSAGLRGALRGSAGFSEGSDPMLVTLGIVGASPEIVQNFLPQQSFEHVMTVLSGPLNQLNAARSLLHRITPSIAVGPLL